MSLDTVSYPNSNDLFTNEVIFSYTADSTNFV